jgi:hypothetical protein
VGWLTLLPADSTGVAVGGMAKRTFDLLGLTELPDETEPA